jgi:hypothetical protein
VLGQHVLVELFDDWPNMIGSETFIMVAFRCTENSTPWPWRRRSAAMKAQRLAAHDGASMISPALTAVFSFSTVVVPSVPSVRSSRPSSAIRADFSLP